MDEDWDDPYAAARRTDTEYLRSAAVVVRRRSPVRKPRRVRVLLWLLDRVADDIEKGRRL